MLSMLLVNRYDTVSKLKSYLNSSRIVKTRKAFAYTLL